MAVTLKAGLSTAGAAFVVIAGVWSGWGALNEHWALKTEVAEMNRTLQLRDNVNYLEGRKNIAQYDLNRINDVLQMYQTRELLNGELDAADRNRVQGLENDMDKAQEEMDGIDETIEAMRLAIQPTH